MRKAKETGKIWTILGAFMLFAGGGLIVYAATSSGGLFDKYKSDNLTYGGMTGVLTAETWDNFIDDLNTRIIEPSCQPGEYFDGRECRECTEGTYSAGGSVTSCTSCTNRPSRHPERSQYVTNGTNNDCGWICNASYYRIDGICSDLVDLELNVELEDKVQKVRLVFDEHYLPNGTYVSSHESELDLRNGNNCRWGCDFGSVYRYSLEKTTGVALYIEAYADRNGRGSASRKYCSVKGNFLADSLTTPLSIDDLTHMWWDCD